MPGEPSRDEILPSAGGRRTGRVQATTLFIPGVRLPADRATQVQILASKLRSHHGFRSRVLTCPWSGIVSRPTLRQATKRTASTINAP
ncbi:MAG: hypothetical protein MZV64_19340 [Ignavibacteriales bacterium]|nr:hypothetical protein [Ignavibacteriales bacterium]